MTKLSDQGHPNRFIEIPKFDKEVWDSVQAMHQKTLVTSILCKTGKCDAKSIAYAALTEEVYEIAHSDETPLHHRIALWHASHNSVKLDVDITDCKTLLLPR